MQNEGSSSTTATLKERGRLLLNVSKQAFTGFLADDAMRLGAALAFYTALSMAPLLVIVVAVAGAVWDSASAQQALMTELSKIVGPDTAETVAAALAKTSEVESSGWAAVVGIVALLFGATVVFAQLQDALNRIWNVEVKRGSSIGDFIAKRLLSLSVVIGIGLLLTLSICASAALSFLVDRLDGGIPGPDVVWALVNALVSLVLYTGLFALLFRVLPDAKVAWRDVWVGAFATAVLFALGEKLIAIYIGRTAVGSAFGAASSLVVLLVWVYYSSFILFLGAEFTQAYARACGRAIEPSDHAVSRPAFSLLQKTTRVLGSAVSAGGARTLSRLGMPVSHGERRGEQAKKGAPREGWPPKGCEDEWRAVAAHPFARQLLAGELSSTSLREFLVQDRRLLLTLCDRAGELASGRDPDTAAAVAAVLRFALVVEMRILSNVLNVVGYCQLDAESAAAIPALEQAQKTIASWQGASASAQVCTALITRMLAYRAVADQLEDNHADDNITAWAATYRDASGVMALDRLFVVAKAPPGGGEVSPEPVRETLKAITAVWDKALAHQER